MPEPQGPLTIIANGIAQRQAALGRLSPREREFERAGNGAGAVAAALYLIVAGAVASSVGVAVCLALLLCGTWSFLIGANRSRGQRDALTGGMALPAIGVGGAGLIFLPGWWLLNAVWIYCLAGGLKLLALSMRGVAAPRLPDPSRVPGMPISRPASRAEARRAMSGRSRFRPPRFRD